MNPKRTSERGASKHCRTCCAVLDGETCYRCAFRRASARIEELERQLADARLTAADATARLFDAMRDRRFEAACWAMNGLLMRVPWEPEAAAVKSIAHADALLARLDAKEPKP